jgi:DNA-binding transcriptional LysR family regulator
VQLHQLRYFVAVADTRHFTHEADLGAPLFERVRGNITLTAAGEALLPLARRVVADVETARREVQELVGLRRGRVRLGATPSMCVSLVPQLLRRFRDAYPRIDLIVEEGGSQDLVRDLTRGGLDLAMIVLPGEGTDPALRAEPILRESLVVASVEPLPGALPGAPLHITDLRDHPMVMFRVGYDLRDATLDACRRAGFVPSFAVEGGEMDAVLSFVEAGLGVALVPGIVVAGRPRLRATPLAPPGVQRTIALAHRRDVVPTNAAQALGETLRTYLRDAARRGDLPAGVEPLG